MTLYTIIVFFIILLNLITYKTDKKSLYTLWVSMFVLMFIAANRSVNVGSDTQSYYANFMLADLDLRANQGIQKGFFYFTTFLSKYTSWNTYLYAIHGIISIGIGTYIVRCSKNYMMSVLLFILLYFYFSSFNIMRQYVAISFVAIAYSFLDSKTNLFFLFTIIACLFHFSAILVFPILFLNKLNIPNKYVYLCVVGSLIMGVLLQNQIAAFLSNISYFNELNDGIQVYLNNAQNSTRRKVLTNVIINTIFLITFYISPNKRSLSLKLYFMYIVLLNLFAILGEGNRFLLYFQIGMLIAIPNTIYELKNKYLAQIYTILILLFSFIIFFANLSGNASDVVPYEFRSDL